jgi:hypothetical protein
MTNSGSQKMSHESVCHFGSSRRRQALHRAFAALALFLIFGLAGVKALTSDARAWPFGFGSKQDAPAAPAQPPAQSPEKGASPQLFAFAKASPLAVFESTELSDGRKASFEFGEAYEVVEETPEAVKLKLDDGTAAYVRSAHVTTARAPKWLAAAPGFNSSERAKVRLWESPVKLNQFLSGINTQSSQWDYEEYFETPPDFSLLLPMIGTDTLELLGGSRQVKIASVMIPISREMYQKFEAATSSDSKPFDLHLLVDVSGSAKGFIEPAIAGLQKSLKRNAQIEKRIAAVTVTSFGESRSKKSKFLGKMSLDALDASKWFQAGEDQTTAGEREPLVDGLVTMQANVKAANTSVPVLMVLSGADVELSGGQGKTVAIENWDPKFPNNSLAIFAQITPEPSEDLRNASRQLRGFSQVRYVDYSGTPGEGAGSELSNALEAGKTAQLSPKTFAGVVDVARKKHMMAFLPRVLTAGSSLPARQSYEAQADWYTVPLWLTFDQLIWKQTTQ